MAKALFNWSRVDSRSLTRPAKAAAESLSLVASSTREALRDSRSSFILSTTTANLSASIVEATCMNAAMGLDLPILASSTRAAAADLGERDESLGIIIWRASTVYSDLTLLAANSAASLTLSAFT